MTVGEMIKSLEKFPAEMEVLVSDGHLYHFYRGAFEIAQFEDKVDIGVGGCNEDKDQEEA